MSLLGEELGPQRETAWAPPPLRPLRAITCPRLGLVGDPASRALFATNAHRCFASSVPAAVTVAHQRAYCLGARHRQCPVFGQSTPVQPDSAAAPPAITERLRRRLRRWWRHLLESP